MTHLAPRISGVTFIKNGLTLGYPIKESIESIAPFCDEVVINVGHDSPDSCEDDGTYAYLRDHFPQKKFIFLRNWWDPAHQKNGHILSVQTNLAMAQAKGKYLFYIQGDEAIHQDDAPFFHEGISLLEKNPHLHGIVSPYLHFYGNVTILKHTRNTYRREVRLIRNGIGLESYKDAQGFRFSNGEKPLCALGQLRIFHYGWARPIQLMKKKMMVMDRLYDAQLDPSQKAQEFNYRRIWGLYPFHGTHPDVLKSWIDQNQSDLSLEKLPFYFHPKDLGLVLSDGFEWLTGIRLGEFKNYQLTKDYEQRTIK